MDKKTEALRLAFEALKELKAVMPIFPKDGDCIIGYKDRYNAAQYQASNAIAAAKQALEQPAQQEPVVQKPTVKYSEFVVINTAEHPELGLVFWANIRGVRGHYRLGNATSVTTSRLVTLPDSKGRFETLNTIYEME